MLTLLAIVMLAMAPLGLADGNDDEEDPVEAAPTPDASSDREEGEPGEEDEVDEDEREDDLDEADRKVEVSVSETQVEIKLEREAGDVEDEVKIVYSADEGWMKVEYRNETATTESESELKVRFREAVEFLDNDSDGAYTPDVDPVLQRFSHEDFNWSIAPPENVTNAAGADGKKIVGTGVLPEGGHVSFVLYAYGDFTQVNGTSLRPTDVKIDILVEDFPYTHEEGHVALLFRTEQEAKLEAEDEEAPMGVNATANGVTAYFTWTQEALVDGIMTRVNTTLVDGDDEAKEEDPRELESSSERAFWFAYARGQSINHDPVMGVAAAEPTTEDAAATEPTPEPAPEEPTPTTDGSTDASNGAGKDTPGPAVAVLVACVAGLALALRDRRRT